MSTFLWVILPYVTLTTFVVGHLWRYRYDKFGWTTRSSQMYESRLLRLGSPLFHLGLLAVIAGHIGGILVPKWLTEAVWISDGFYHFASVSLGTLAGLATVAGFAILVYRRITVASVRRATTKVDVVTYILLGAVFLLGMWNTVGGNLIGGGYDYRETVSPWFRSLFLLSPLPELMATAPLSFQLHNIVAMLLFALWPFTRLVHVFSAPVGYLVRPYVVYRSREPRRGHTEPARGWDPVH
ncbi:MAG: respiratory nitrate reductase subunit gamma [Pseudonocardia sp.]